MFADSPIMSWRASKHQYRLEGVTCLTCSHSYYPQKYRCVCGGLNFEPVQFSGRGKLLSFTQITISPTAFVSMVPYHLGLIELEEGVRLVSQVTDVALEELFIGMQVVATFRKYYASGEKGIIHYGIKFMPAPVLPVPVPEPAPVPEFEPESMSPVPERESAPVPVLVPVPEFESVSPVPAPESAPSMPPVPAPERE